MGRGQADGDAEQRHVDQEQVDAALGEKLVISAGIPRRRRSRQTGLARPVRTVDPGSGCIARAAAGRAPMKTQAAISRADEVDSRLGSSLWPMITPPSTGPTIWPSAETVVSAPNLLMRASGCRPAP